MPLQLATAHEERPSQKRQNNLHQPSKKPPLRPPRISDMLTDHHATSRLQQMIQPLYRLLRMWHSTQDPNATNLIKNPIFRRPTRPTTPQDPGLAQRRYQTLWLAPTQQCMVF